MNTRIKIENLIRKLSGTTKHEIFWQGEVDDEQIVRLENKLSFKLPKDFKVFLERTGGGGVVGQEISGIEGNDPLAKFGGTIYYDTLYCRNEYSLPDNFAVIYFKEDEVCWCLDTSSNGFGNVISYDIFLKKKIYVTHNSFRDFFEEYVDLRS